MTEQVPSGRPEDQASDRESALDQSATEHAVTATGLPAVDQVLADVDLVDGLPLDQHQEAFERAHTALRSALDAGPDDPV
jgi:hypothetical protein